MRGEQLLGLAHETGFDLDAVRIKAKQCSEAGDDAKAAAPFEQAARIGAHFSQCLQRSKHRMGIARNEADAGTVFCSRKPRVDACLGIRQERLHLGRQWPFD